MKISVITAVYNRRDTISHAIDSVLAQTHKDTELIVIDGGSTDGTLEVLKRYGNRIAVLVSEPDRGMYDALNKGLNLATGDVVGFLNSDDVLANPQALARIAGGFFNRGVDAVYGDLIYVSQYSGEVVRYWESGVFGTEKLRRGWMPPHPTFYARRALYKRLGGYDLTYQISSDYELMLRFLRSGIHVTYLPHVLVKMRTGGASNRSIGNILRKMREDHRALRTHQLPAMRALAWKNLSKLPQFIKKWSGS